MFETMTDEEVECATELAIEFETRSQTNVVRHFVEIYRRDIHLKRGYSSVYLWAIEKYGCSKTSVQRRTSAMELALAVPEVLDFIDQKRMYLQSAADIQKFLNCERGKRTPYSPDLKRELVYSLLDLTTQDVEQRLVGKNPDISFKDSKKLIAPGRYRVVYSAKEETEKKIERIKSMRSHAQPYANRDEIISYMADVVLDKIDPKKKAERHEKRASKKSQSHVDLRGINEIQENLAADNELSPAPDPIETVDEIVGDVGEIQIAMAEVIKPRTRYIEASQRYQAHQTTGGCVYVDSKTGKRCGSARIQLDHIHAYSEGGENKAGNLQQMCGAHNRFRYRQEISFDEANADWRGLNCQPERSRSRAKIFP